MNTPKGFTVFDITEEIFANHTLRVDIHSDMKPMPNGSVKVTSYAITTCTCGGQYQGELTSCPKQARQAK